MYEGYTIVMHHTYIWMITIVTFFAVTVFMFLYVCICIYFPWFLGGWDIYDSIENLISSDIFSSEIPTANKSAYTVGYNLFVYIHLIGNKKKSHSVIDNFSEIYMGAKVL